MNNQVPKFIWLFQIIASAAFLYAGIHKFLAMPEMVAVFSSLEMEPHGRYIIAVIEVLTGLLLLTPQLSALGSFMGLGVMLGAAIAHTTVLGLSISGDSGKSLGALIGVFFCCFVITWFRKKEIPLIGNSF